MSWFSAPFALLKEDDEERRGGEKDDDEEEEDEDEEEEDSINFAAIASATGATVKEDLSNLTKTFSRQLWGVASFLAPPPTEKSNAAPSEGKEEGVGDAQEAKIEESKDIIGASGGFAHTVPGDDGQGFTDLRFGDSESNFSPIAVSPPPHAFAFGDSTASKDDDEGNTESKEGSDKQRLIGVRSDLAELRGTVAAGFSRLSNAIRVVTGDDNNEDDNDEQGPGSSTRESSHLLSRSGSDDQHVNSPRLVLDSLLKPLLGNILSREDVSGDTSSQGEESEEKVVSDRRCLDRERLPVEMDSFPAAIANSIGGLSKFATTILNTKLTDIVGDDDDDDEEEQNADDDAERRNLQFGLTDSVISFARSIAMHPETWLDFPKTEEDANDDFELNDAQKEHINALEIVAPDLVALKLELCPGRMTEQRFWKIYFVLMHSRLSSKEAVDLSTDQVVRARASILKEFQNKEFAGEELRANQGEATDKQGNTEFFGSREWGRNPAETNVGLDYRTQTYSSVLGKKPSSSFETERERGRIDAAMSARGDTKLAAPKSESGKGKYSMNVEEEAEVDEWLHDESVSKSHNSGGGVRTHPDASLDEDVSFSDLEEDESSDRAAESKGTNASSSAKGSGGALPRGESSSHLGAGEGSSSSTQGDSTPRKSSEFNDWLTVNQDDVASAGSSSP